MRQVNQCLRNRHNSKSISVLALKGEGSFVRHGRGFRLRRRNIPHMNGGVVAGAE